MRMDEEGEVLRVLVVLETATVKGGGWIGAVFITVWIVYWFAVLLNSGDGEDEFKEAGGCRNKLCGEGMEFLLLLRLRGIGTALR